MAIREEMGANGSVPATSGLGPGGGAPGGNLGATSGTYNYGNQYLIPLLGGSGGGGVGCGLGGGGGGGAILITRIYYPRRRYFGQWRIRNWGFGLWWKFFPGNVAQSVL